MKAIVIYTNYYRRLYEEIELTIVRVISIDDKDLPKIDVDDILQDGQEYEIVDLQQARIEIKNVLKWGE